MSSSLPDALLTLRAACPSFPIDTRAGRWEVIDTGAGGVPVVLLPGALGTADTFYRQIAHLAPHLRVVSASYPADDEPDRICDALAELLDRLGLDRVSLFGTSLGGYLAQRFAMRHGGRLHRAVVSNTFADASRVTALEAFDQARAAALSAPALQAEWLARLEAAIARQGATELGRIQHDRLTDARHDGLLRSRLLLLGRCTLPPQPVHAGLAIIDCEDDPVIDAVDRRRLRAQYPAARVHCLSRGGHYPYIVNPDAFNRVLEEEFIA